MAPPPARSPAKKSPQQTNLLCPVGPARHGGPAFHRSAACSNKKRPARQEPAPFGLREPSSRFSVATLFADLPADHFAGNNDLHPPVQLAPRRRLVVRHRVGLSQPL